jgi:hypothetical protein
MKFLTLFCLLFVTNCYSQELTINPYTGVAPSFAISEIDKLTFGNDSLFVHLNSGTVYSWYLLDLQNMQFEEIVSLYEESLKLIDVSIYPNPASEWLVINYSSPEPQEVQIELVDALGKTLKRFPSFMSEEGGNSVKWNFSDSNLIHTGIVFCIIRSEDQTITKSVVIK